MILPIHTYGLPVLRTPADPVPENTEELQRLIDDMVETMREASGVGLAAPQIGRSLRLFVVDLSPLAEDLEADGEEVPPQPMVFINPEVSEVESPDVDFEEGCLSIPEIREMIVRPDRVRVRYTDRDWAPREIVVSGMLARVVQHEYDHLDGVLFVDHLSPFRRSLLKRRLREMARGVVEADYEIATPEPDRA